MLIRNLLVVLVAAACATNPDPRSRSIDSVVRDGHGGWIAVTSRSGAEVRGELIAVDADAVRVLTSSGLASIAKPAVATARLWAWPTGEGNIAMWGIPGTLSTISHGYWLVFSAPVWIIATTAIAAVESRASIIDYPDDGWDKLSPWARFPQGLPAGVSDRDLVRQSRVPPPGFTPPPGSPPPPGAPPPPALGSTADGAVPPP